MFPSGVFAPRVFPPRVFPRRSSVAPPVVTTPRRDDYVLRDLADRLLATGYFAEVSRGVMPSERELPADYAAMAWVKRRDWTEVPESGALGHDRTVQYDLTIAVAGPDPDLRHDRLCQAEAAALNVLNRRSLAGFTMPSFTTLTAGRDGPGTDASVSVVCAGRFRYLVTDGQLGHDESDPVV